MTDPRLATYYCSIRTWFFEAYWIRREGTRNGKVLRVAVRYDAVRYAYIIVCICTRLSVYVFVVLTEAPTGPPALLL